MPRYPCSGFKKENMDLRSALEASKVTRKRLTVTNAETHILN
jgi:hypothetical protein